VIIIKKYHLITLDVIYYRNDYPSILNEFIIQLEDSIPDTPKVVKFLDHWKNNNLAVIKDILISYSNDSKIISAKYMKNLN
jgi:uncharacterized protein Usg